jgi:hypothetical protein
MIRQTSKPETKISASLLLCRHVCLILRASVWTLRVLRSQPQWAFKLFFGMTASLCRELGVSQMVFCAQSKETVGHGRCCRAGNCSYQSPQEDSEGICLLVDWGGCVPPGWCGCPLVICKSVCGRKMPWHTVRGLDCVSKCLAQ